MMATARAIVPSIGRIILTATGRLLVGVLFACLMTVVVLVGVFAYGVANSPWHFSLSAGSLQVIRFVILADGRFGLDLGTGALVAVTVFAVLAAIVSAILNQRFRR